MARRLQGIVGVAVAALMIVGVAYGFGAASLYGTWLGTPTFPGKRGPRYVYDPIKLVAGPVRVRVESTGLTGASHDAADAKSTCTTRYRFNSVLSADGWRLYVQEGRPKVSGSVAGGPPTSGVCGPYPLATYRGAVRLRPAGAKLRVEFGAVNPALRVIAPNDFDAVNKSGYLHH